MSENNSQKRKVLLFLGEMTDRVKAKLQAAAKAEGIDTVEFVDVPQEPILKSASVPCVQKAQECAMKVCGAYERWFPTLYQNFHECVSAISWKNEPPIKTKVIHHLCDRILHVPLNTTKIHAANPAFSFIDCASLNRSLFEAIVNCLFILTDRSNNALAGVLVKSVDEDVKLRNGLLKWATNPDPGISEGAKLQAAHIKTQTCDKTKLLKGLPRNPPPYPNIKERCESLDSTWQFLYMSRYRQMCAWSHVHAESAFYSPSATISSPQDLADSISKGTEMVYLSSHLVHLFLLSLTEWNHQVQDKLNADYQDILNELCPIFQASGNLTSPIGAVEN